MVYSLTRRAAPRFWRPAEPVVLLAGDAVQPTHRHGYDGRLRDDGLLPCEILATPGFAELTTEGLALLRTQLDAIAARGDSPIAFRSSAGRPWNPVLLEWMVEFFPARPKHGGDQYGGPYPHDYIDRNYTLEAEAVDLRHGHVTFAKGASVYRGVSILTPHAGMQLDRSIARELARLIKPDLLAAFFHDQTLPADGGESALLSHLAAFNGWAGAQIPPLPPLPPGRRRLGARTGRPVGPSGRSSHFSAWRQSRSAVLARFYAAQPPGTDQGEQWLHAHLDDFWPGIRARSRDCAPSFRRPARRRTALKPTQLERGRAELAGLKLDLPACHSCALPCCGSRQPRPSPRRSASFNDALLMRRQRFQLPVADPLGFDDDQRFAATVAAAVGRRNRSAPQPLDDFNPIRAGALNLLRLRLIDSFGQTRELAWNEVVAAETLHPLDSRYPVVLPPRIVQPTRLNMRFLAARSARCGDERAARQQPDLRLAARQPSRPEPAGV